MERILRPLVSALLLACALLPQTASTQVPSLRVCGDPDNLPYSNDKLEGFENKIAALIAADLGATASYVWWPHQRGLVRNTLDAGTCDVIFGLPEGLERVLLTKPYYHSAYVIAFRKSGPARVVSLDAPELKRLKIGVYSNTPVEESLARRGLLDNVSTYSLFFDPRGDRDRPAKLLDDLVRGAVDVAVPWGPLAGYHAKRLQAPIEFVPLRDEPGVPAAFGVAMGVNKGNRELKARLEAAIDRRQAEIRAVLEDYGVPLVAAHEFSAGVPPVQDPAAAGGPPVAPAAQAQNPPPTAGPPPAAAEPGAAPGSLFKKLNPFAGNAEAIAEGKALYFKVGCQGCHGGGGGGGMAASLIDERWKFGSDDETLYKLIKGQIPGQTMPTVYGALPDEQVWKMLAFIRSVYKGDPAKINW